MSHNRDQNVFQVEYGFSFRSLKFYKPPHHSLSESSTESSKTTTQDETPIDAKRYPNDTKQP